MPYSVQGKSLKVGLAHIALERQSHPNTEQADKGGGDRFAHIACEAKRDETQKKPDNDRGEADQNDRTNHPQRYTERQDQ